LHKIVNVLDKVPLSVQPKMKQDLREICLAPNRAAAEAALNVFAEKYRVKFGKAVECLTKDRESLLTFYDLPAEHWEHVRMTNPIESVFATVRHRTVRTKGSLSSATAKLMVFKLIIAASKTWRRLNGQISCRKSSEVSNSKTASRSSKCLQTAPPDRLITQNPA
jgi:transposase-like protein